MTHGELWREIMWYGKFDRMPVIHWGGWPEVSFVQFARLVEIVKNIKNPNYHGKQ